MTTTALLLSCVLTAIQTPTPPVPPTAPAGQTGSPAQKPDPKADPKAQQTAKPTVELLVPAPLDLTTTNGQGTMPFRLLITGAAADITKIDATAPVGDGQALQGAVTVQVESSTPLQENQRVQAAVLTVKAAQPMPQNVKFAGLLIVPGLGRLAYSVTDKTNVVLSSSPDRIAVTWLVGQPDVGRLQVRNAGTSSFALNAAAVSLEDAGSKRRVEQPLTMTPTAQTIASGQSRQVTVTLPRPLFAGTYAGTLSLHSETDSFAVPVTITTRGPAPGGQLWIPFGLFVLTVVAGIWLSSKLERFFGEGGGLRRAETVVALGTLENALERVDASLQTVVRNTGLRLPKVLAQFSPLRDAVRTARTVPNTPDIERVLTEGHAAQAAGMLLARLLEAGVPPLNGDPQALTALSNAIEALPWPVDHASFQTFNLSLRNVIDKAHQDLIARSQQERSAALQANLPAPAAPEPGPMVLPPGTPISIDEALAQITRMTRLQNAAIWLVTVLTAYQTFYAANAAFGTGMHYLGLFMWALGITQAGTQIVARARRPAN